MYPYICHIYGPLYLNCYGLAIFLGILVFSYMLERDRNFLNIFPTGQFSNLLFWSILVGIAGGRTLYVLEDPREIVNFFKIWQAGYSFLGTLIALLIFVPIYLKKLNVNILQFLDIAAIYAPLLHSIARIGCFCAGCCQGIPTTKFWGIIYKHPGALIPDNLKFISIHPTQIYSSIILFLIFCFMFYVAQKRVKFAGQLAATYLMLTTLERFFVDFLRSDQEFFSAYFLKAFSIHQWISLVIFLVALVCFVLITFRSHPSGRTADCGPV